MKCKECNKEFSRTSDLSKHVGISHGSQKDYYDKYLKKENEEICSCGNPTEYTGRWQRGYKKSCSEICRKKDRVKKIEKTNLKKYGVKNANHVKEVRDKIDKTNKEKYGNICPMQNKEIQKDIRAKNLKNLGVELPFQSKEIQKKNRESMKRKYGFEFSFQVRKFYDKMHNTMIKKYGVPHSMQNLDSFEKGFKTRIQLHEFKNTGILYQASYELDFLEKYYDIFYGITRGPSIKYRHGDKDRVYHSDFFLPSENLIIEIKNSYLAKRDKGVLLEKKKYCEKSGYKWIMIIDKNYEEFDSLNFCMLS